MRALLAGLAIALLAGCSQPTAPVEVPARSVVELAFTKVEPKLGKLTLRSSATELEIYRGELSRIRDSLTGALSVNDEDDIRREVIDQEVARIDAAQAVKAGTKTVEDTGRDVFNDPDMTYLQIEEAQAGRTANASLTLAIERVKVATRSYDQAANQVQELLFKLKKLQELPSGANGNGRANGT